MLLFTGGALAQQSAGERLRALADADRANSSPRADRMPDLSMDAIRRAESQDQAALEKLHQISPDQLNPDEQILYALLERQFKLRIDQIRARLYLTPFWQDPRFTPWFDRLGREVYIGKEPRTVEAAEQLLRKLESRRNIVDKYEHL